MIPISIAFFVTVVLVGLYFLGFVLSWITSSVPSILFRFLV